MSRQYAYCLDNELRLTARELPFCMNWPAGMNCPAGHMAQFISLSAAKNHARSANHDAKRHFINQQGDKMAENQLVTLSKAFAVNVINLCEKARERKRASAIVNQLLRSGTSIGANVHEANYASSKADFINKFQIALKECFETDYWLDIFHNAGIISDEEYADAFAQCCKIRKLLIASITTAKRNSEKLTDRDFQLKQGKT